MEYDKETFNGLTFRGPRHRQRSKQVHRVYDTPALNPHCRETGGYRVESSGA